MSPPQGISTFLPFLVTGIFCFLEKLLFTKENHHSLVPEPSQLLSNAFRNYFSFIGIMVALRLVITPSKFGFNRKSNHMEPQNALFSLNNPLEAEPTNSSQIKQVIIHFCKLMISYTLLFGCFQFIFALAFHFPRNSPQDIINSSVSQPSSRYLDQITIPEDFIEPERLIPSPYLNPGEILGSINPGYLKDGPAYLELLISKDAKTLFTFNNFTLEVFDISNPKKPSKIGSLEDIGLLQAVLLLSPKEDFLYMLSWDRFWIINITDKTSPSKASSQIFEWRSFVNEIDFYFSMVISSDGITLWTVNNGRLRAWDVSDPKVPEEYFAEIPDRDYRGSLAISKDDKRLVIGLEEGFKIYNITTPRRAYMLKTVDTIGRVYSIAFSHDDTKLLLGVQNDINRGIRIFDFELVIFDIADLASPTLLLSHKLNREASYGKLWFHENEKYAFFNSKREFRMINILDGEQTTLFSTLSDLKGLPFTASPDNKINIVYISGMIHIMKFNIDITPGSFLHFKQNSLQVIDDMDFERRRVMEISKDGKNLFLVRMDTVIPSFGEMVPYERKSCATFEKLSPSSQLDAYINEQLRDDAQWIFAIGKNISVVTYVPNRGSSFFLINMTNKTKSYPFAQNKIYFSRIPAVALTNDEKSLVFVNHTNDIKSNTSTLRLNIVTWDVKTMRVTSSLTNFNMPFSLCYPFSVMKTNQDDSLLFYANCDLLIYNITNPSAPILEFSLSLNVSQTYSFILSKNEKILYLFGSDSSSSSRSKLLIFNISNPRSPQLLSSSFIEQNLFSESTESLELNSDETTLFIGFLGGILLVDIRSLTQPVLFGFNYFLDQMYTPRFTDNKTMLYTSSFKGVTAYDFSSHYILYFKNSEFKIGGSYSILLNVLKQNNNKKFDFMTKKHKFLKVTFLEQSSTSALPNWVTFDKEKSLLKIEPNSPSTNNTYKISATLSTQTQPAAFTGLVDDAESLMLDLTRSGYLDNQGYISGDFELNQRLRIDPRYKKLEMDILAILSKSYIQAIAEISVTPSLSLSETKPLKISTLSKNTVYVTIQLDQGRFLTKLHSSLKPVIDNKRSLLYLEGLLENVNEVLKEIVVDLNGLQACSGVISINDGINPPIISHRIPSLSNYLHVNEKPENSIKNIQDQMDLNPFYTGLYSAIDINSAILTDKNNVALEYSLELEDPKLGLPPAWITLKGLSLMATPPESYTKFSYKFALRVANEFQNITVPFTLKVKISFYYAVKLAMTFLGYTVTLIGAVYSVNKAYNILARKYYRHPRSFKLKVGEEINDSKIFSVSFINNEMEKIKNIFKTLEKYVSQNYQKSLVEYFVDSQSQVLDKEKIMTTLESLENEDYKQTDSFSSRIIQQLIINKIIMKQLESKQGASTKEIFNKIKDKWMDLVIVSSSAPSQFVINSENLAEELSRFSMGYGGESLDETHFESSDLLIKKNKLNMDLLANAIISCAFDYQNLNVDLIFIDVISYKRIRGKTLFHLIKKFLLKNLKPFVFLNKREIGYGIEYRIENNTLHFFGKLTHELKNDTIVVHLKNHRGRILREFWITGENTEIQLQNYLHNHDSETL